MTKNGFEEKKITAWLRDTTTGQEIVDREVEMKCQTCTQRPGVLLVYGVDPGGPAWCEVYCDRTIDVFTHQWITVLPESESLAERYLEGKMSLRARGLFVPGNLRRVIGIQPRTAEEELHARETVACVRELKGPHHDNR